MLLDQADNTNPSSTSGRLRRKRIALLLELIQRFVSPVRVLDVGGTAGFWKAADKGSLVQIHLTILNREATGVGGLPSAESVVGDARDLSPFSDKSFDVCFSNSVIEHVGSLFDQMAMACEIARVSRAYFVQTPNRFFPIEPHFHVPFWPFLPIALRAGMHRRMILGWMKRQPDPVLARAEVEQIRLLTRRELEYLFPDATIVRERLAGLTKSFFAIRFPVPE